MNAFTTYKIIVNGDLNQIQKVGEFLKSKITDVEFEIGKEIDINETCDIVFPKDVSELALNMAKIVDVPFEMSGLIDTSFSAGEYMDFKFIYQDGVLFEQYSDWYVEDCMDQWDSFEEFNESFDGVFGEEVYEKFKKCGFMYTLETDDGDILSETVPLVHEHRYEIKDKK